MGKTRFFHFVIPQLKKAILGTQGEVAQYIPYRVDEELSSKDILDELRAQPHMAPLADYISSDRKLYLIDSENEELLQLAAEYIGTYHRLADGVGVDGESMEDCDEDKDAWENGDTNFREFDFGSNLPYLMEHELMRIYDPEEGMGFGGRFYRQENTSTRPWWTMSMDAPLAVMTRGSLNSLPPVLRSMQNRERIILLHERSDRLYDDSCCWSGAMRMEDLSFEMETEMLVLHEPEEDSGYKKAILRQLAREKGTSFAPSYGAGKLLSLVKESRGDINNATLSKVISNALLRKKDDKPLCAGDFQYLSTIRSNGKQRTKGSAAKMELVGQENVRRQLERIVNSMAFQQKRKKMGLPVDEFHYTFAFLGAPGTGKTTWAMRLAEEMEKRGLLENTECICVNAAELKAQYVGHTTGKVKALFDQYGVIILDEAYSLTEGEHGDSFGSEALAQLCVELEKHGNDRLVIFAGYGGSSNTEDNRMLRFLQSNPGINSRVSFKIHFENFQPAELNRVFRTMMDFGGYAIPEEADGVVTDFFSRRITARAFGNCREVRNLADRVKIYAAQRLAECSDLTGEEANRILVEDVRGAVREILEEYEGLAKNDAVSIGF